MTEQHEQLVKEQIDLQDENMLLSLAKSFVDINWDKDMREENFQCYKLMQLNHKN